MVYLLIWYDGDDLQMTNFDKIADARIYAEENCHIFYFIYKLYEGKDYRKII